MYHTGCNTYHTGCDTYHTGCNAYHAGCDMYRAGCNTYHTGCDTIIPDAILSYRMQYISYRMQYISYWVQYNYVPYNKPSHIKHLLFCKEAMLNNYLVQSEKFLQRLMTLRKNTQCHSSFIRHRHQVGQPDHGVDGLCSLMQSYSH